MSANMSRCPAEPMSPWRQTSPRAGAYPHPLRQRRLRPSGWEGSRHRRARCGGPGGRRASGGEPVSTDLANPRKSRRRSTRHGEADVVSAGTDDVVIGPARSRWPKAPPHRLRVGSAEDETSNSPFRPSAAWTAPQQCSGGTGGQAASPTLRRCGATRWWSRRLAQPDPVGSDPAPAFMVRRSLKSGGRAVGDGRPSCSFMPRGDGGRMVPRYRDRSRDEQLVARQTHQRRRQTRPPRQRRVHLGRPSPEPKVRSLVSQGCWPSPALT